MKRRFLLRTSAFAVCVIVSIYGNLFAKDGSESKTLVASSGCVKLVLRGESGTFQIYALGEKGKETAVFSGADAFTSTYFSLFTGKKIYRLSASGGTATGAARHSDGAALVYKIHKIADVTVDFSFVKSPGSAFRQYRKSARFRRQYGKGVEYVRSQRRVRYGARRKNAKAFFDGKYTIDQF